MKLACFKTPSQFHWAQQLARTASGWLIRKAENLGYHKSKCMACLNEDKPKVNHGTFIP
jgi:hypothetical protein